MGTDPADRSTTPRLPRRILIAILALGCVGVIQALLVEPRQERPPFYDELRFRVYATNLADRGFFGDEAGKFPATVELRSVGLKAGIAPGYPFFLAALRSAGAPSHAAVRVTQSVIAGATVVGVALLGWKIFGGAAGVTAGALLLLTGVPATYAQFGLSELLATATLTWAVVVTLIAFDRRSWTLMLAAGAAFGISALVRPQILLLPVALGAWAFLAGGRSRSSALLGAALIAGMILALTPWTVRNYARLDALVPVATYSRETFFLANVPHFKGVFTHPEAYIGEAEVRRIRSLPELEQERAWRSLAFGWIKEHPGDAIRGWARNGRLYLTLEDHLLARWYQIRGRSVWRLDDRLLFPLGLAGTVLAAAARMSLRRTMLPLIVALYSAAFFCFNLPIPRYRVGMTPMLTVLVGGIVAFIGSMIARRRAEATSAA